MEFVHSFLRRHLPGKPVVVLPNVGCFVRLFFLQMYFSLIVYDNNYVEVFCYQVIFHKNSIPYIKFCISG